MINICDVGALPLPSEGKPVYQSLLDGREARLIPFDPQMGGVAVGNEGLATLYVCAYPGWTSLLRPNALANQIFRKQSRIVDEVTVETCRLDDLDVGDIDLLKIDAQGSELAVLETGRKVLKKCVAVQVEVPFISLYVNQPQFWEIDRELREQGFFLHKFVAFKYWSDQLLEADALYVRDFVTNGVSPKLQMIARCYGSLDLAGDRRKVA